MSSDRSASHPDDDISDERILDVFRRSVRPFQTASDVADRFDIARQSAHRRLQSLYEEGRLNKETVGAHAVVWWLQEDAQPIPEDDPFFHAGPLFASDDPVDETEIDDVIYGEG